jgi:hypothetical protein
MYVNKTVRKHRYSMSVCSSCVNLFVQSPCIALMRLTHHGRSYPHPSSLSKMAHVPIMRRR